MFTLALGAFLLWRGVLRIGPDVDRVIKGLQDQLVYVEDRRKEERDARLEAEERLESNNQALREATTGFRESNTLIQSLMERLDVRRPARS